ncbi:MAG: TonB-dependent receptor [Ignavibacteria bacterium]|jgi:TonB-dependent receptor
MNLPKQFLSICFLLLICSSVLVAQNGAGRIQGVVRDTTTGDDLFGANIYLRGTSMGAASDMEGRYLIPGVPVGTYTLVARYIGYEQKEITIEVQANKTLQVDVFLLTEAIEGEEIVVTGQAQGQREAINQQLTSNTIINVVSAEKIHQLPDDNAATALSRLPGVSLMNGDQVVIRGVQAKLNQVLINGIQMPSTNMNDRSANLGFISSNMLSGIEVVKALTPDMDANAVGGVVNLRIREAPSGLHFDVLTQGNYNYSDRNTNNYKLWASVSNRFFDDKFGVFVQANIDHSDGGNQSASRGLVMDGSVNTSYGEAVYLTNSGTFQYDRDIVTVSGGSLILDYKLPNGKVVLQNTYAGNFIDQRHNRILLDFDNTLVAYTIDRNKYGKDLWINALQAENTFGDIKVEASLSHSSTKQYTRIAYEPYGNGSGWTDFENNSSHQAPFGLDGDTPITYTSNSAQRSMSMEKLYSIFDNLTSEDADSATLEGWVSSYKNTFKQHLYNMSLDVTMPLNFSKDITTEFKGGGKYVRTTRDNDYDKTYSGASDDDTYITVDNYFPDRPRSPTNRLRFTDVMESDFERGENFLSDEYDFTNGFQYVINTDIYDDWLRQAEKGWTPVTKQDDSWKDDWHGSEQFSAGYFMGTFNLFQKLTLITGIRYESYHMDYHANFTNIIHSVYGDAISTAVGTITINDNPDPPDSLYHIVPSSFCSVKRTDVNFFPNVHLKYKVNDWSDIRVAYTTGIARPDYLSIIPKVAVYSGNTGTLQVGNPKLKPTTVNSFDIIASVYSNEVGLFTINGFYKELSDVMYNTNIYYGSISEYTDNVFVPDSVFMAERFTRIMAPQNIINTALNNPNTGYIRGVEIGWQTNFWYLPKPFNSLVLDVNYTKSGSNIDYQIHRQKQTVIQVTPRLTKTIYSMSDTTYSGRLIQHANDVVNVTLGIDYEGFSGRLSFNMKGNVLNYVGSRPEENSYTGNIYRWDFTLKQDLPINGLSIALNGVNIFHNGVKTYRKYRLTPDAPISENLISVVYSPTIYQFSLRYNL